MVFCPFGLNGDRGLVLPVFRRGAPEGFFTHSVKGIGEQVEDDPTDILGYDVQGSQAGVKMGVDRGVKGLILRP